MKNDNNSHSELDINYHNIIAKEYESVVNEPRKLSNDILFAPLLKSINTGIDNFLDLGCGTGQMVERISRKLNPQKIYGVDHSSAMLAEAKTCASKLGLDNFQAINEDIFSFMENTSTQFSLISAVGVIHHLQPDKVHYLLELCYKALDKNGWLLLAEPVETESLHTSYPLVDKWNARSAFKGRDYSEHADEPDEHPLEEGALEKQLSAAGFKTIKTNRGIELFPRNNPPSFFDKTVIKLMQKIYGSDGFVCAWLLQKS